MRLLAQARNPYSRRAWPLGHSRDRKGNQARLLHFRECGKPQGRSWLWIPGSLVSLAPRNDEEMMTDHYDALETRDPATREAVLFARLPYVLRKAMAAPAYAERLKGTDPAEVTSRVALARLPVQREAELPALAQM